MRPPMAAMIVALALLLVPAARAEPPAQVQIEVNFLLGYVDGSGCEFYRNGSWHDAKEAEAHLRDKYKFLVARNLVNTTEQFIERVATKSSISGEPYGVRCNGGATVASSQWLRDELARFRKSHPDVGPVRERNPSGPRFLRSFRFASTIEGDRFANERLEDGLADFFSFVDVDRAAYVSVEARVEQTSRILQGCALGEGKLHLVFVGFARADDAVVRPDRSAHPLPLLDDVRVRFLDERAHPAEGFLAPVPELGDSFRDEFRGRLALVRA
jgi:hypothetical protein